MTSEPLDQGLGGQPLGQGYFPARALPVFVLRALGAQPVLRGMRGPQPLLGGWAVPPPLVRETFSVPIPDGEVAVRHAAQPGSAYLGAGETGVAFALDFGAWLGAQETLWGLQVAVSARPTAAGSTPYAATAQVVQAGEVAGSRAVVALYGAQPQTFYVVAVAVQTSSGRTLACRLPRIWCPD